MSTLDQEDITALVNELVKQSQRLGLTWSLRRGTITSTGTAVILDADESNNNPPAVPFISLIGSIGAAARVMTLQVPPSGLYVLSWLDQDTGTINDTDAGASLDISMGAGWTLSSYTYRMIGNVMYLRVGATRTGATITADAAGNIADTTVYTLNVHRPMGTIIGAFRATVSGGAAQINSSGVCTIVDMHSTSTILATQIVQTYWVYPIA
jgi:hypothetical protein